LHNIFLKYHLIFRCFLKYMSGSPIHVQNSDIKGGLNIDEKYCLKSMDCCHPITSRHPIIWKKYKLGNTSQMDFWRCFFLGSFSSTIPYIHYYLVKKISILNEFFHHQTWSTMSSKNLDQSKIIANSTWNI
jgi:hypothetical protein